jgi:hypothetical protein
VLRQERAGVVRIVGGEREGRRAFDSNKSFVRRFVNFKNQTPYTAPIFLISSAMVTCSDSGDSTRALAP